LRPAEGPRHIRDRRGQWHHDAGTELRPAVHLQRAAQLGFARWPSSACNGVALVSASRRTASTPRRRTSPGHPYRAGGGPAAATGGTQHDCPALHYRL
jgi:hypothetical protein